VVDECGVIHPVFRNLSIHNIWSKFRWKELRLRKKVRAIQLCNTIRGMWLFRLYIDTLPNGPNQFNCISRWPLEKTVCIKEEQRWRNIYQWVWTDTVVKTLPLTLQCETDDHGCICDTERNVTMLCESCGYPNFNPQINSGNFTTQTEPYLVGGLAVCPPDPSCNEGYILWQ